MSQAKVIKFTSTDTKTSYFSILNIERSLKCMKDKEEVVISDSIIQMLFDFPFFNEFLFTFSSYRGFTREQLMRIVHAKYCEIYDEESKTYTRYSSKKSKYVDKLNRGNSNGKYGIWGYELEDLFLYTIEYKAALDVYVLGITGREGN